MGIFKALFNKNNSEKPKHPQNNYSFDDEDRAISAELRQQKKQLKILQMKKEAELARLEFERDKLELMQDISDLQQEDTTETDTEEDSLLKMMLPLLLQQREAQPPKDAAAIVQPSLAAGQTSYSEEAILDILNNLPKSYKALAKKCSNSTIQQFLRANIIGLSDANIEFAIRHLKGS